MELSATERNRNNIKSSSSNSFSTEQLDQINENHREWLKVIYLTIGDEIAIIEPQALSFEHVLWDKIESITFVGYEQVYDIAVEGTHNFIANDILAHNTYISGNVGIGTTGPDVKLSIIGNNGSTNTTF
ncbi:MAG: hypothetical protein COX77_03205, partial [Candidatus Komeilibacteria bacterium CG_4_10_14_0_2_um_filter_37_10]